MQCLTKRASSKFFISCSSKIIFQNFVEKIFIRQVAFNALGGVKIFFKTFHLNTSYSFSATSSNIFFS